MSTFDINTTGEQIVEQFGQHAKGKTFLITGPSPGGLGATLALTLAPASPSHLILAGRNPSKIQPLLTQIHALNPSIKLSLVQLDLLSITSVRRAAKEILSLTEGEGIHVMINNAGVAARREFEKSEEGVEGVLAANYLGHWVLTNLLVGRVEEVKGVVVNVASGAYVLAEVDVGDVNFEDGKNYNAWIAYGRSKTANILLTYALAKKYDGKLISLVVDPGMAHDSNLLTNSSITPPFLAEGIALASARFLNSPMPEPQLVSLQQGVATMLRAALDPSLRTKAPAFLKECEIATVLPYASDEEEALRLWAWSERVVGEEFGW